MAKNKILLIDDERDIIAIVTTLLETHDYEVISVRCAEDGIQAAKQLKPDCILMDICLPGMDGFEAVKVIRKDQELAMIPILMLTVDTSPESVETGFTVDADGYVMKGQMDAVLVDRIEKLLSK